jgi:hypothetical protein
MSKFEIIGVYSVEADEPLHLIEVCFHGLRERFDLCGITQEWPGKDRKQWQVPYLEHILNSAGDAVQVDWFKVDESPEHWQGDVRMVFFFHYLDFDRPLQTPFGDVVLPAATPLPSRLSNKITYMPT